MKIIAHLTTAALCLLVIEVSKADAFEDATKVCEDHPEQIPKPFPSCEEFNQAYKEYEKKKADFEKAKAKAEGIANGLISYGKIKETEERIK